MKWPSVLLLCELVFSLPFSNGRVEQIFSSLKVIKTTNRASLHTTTLDDLLEICIEGPPLARFSADSAIDLWWSDCHTTRRTNQTKRKPYRPRRPPSPNQDCTGSRKGIGDQETDSQEDPITLDSTSSDTGESQELADSMNAESDSEELSLSTILEDWDNLFL